MDGIDRQVLYGAEAARKADMPCASAASDAVVISSRTPANQLSWYDWSKTEDLSHRRLCD